VNDFRMERKEKVKKKRRGPYKEKAEKGFLNGHRT